MQTLKLPEVGKIYAPKDAPEEAIYVETVDVIEADEDTDAGFCVTGCAPKDAGDIGASGIEIYDDVWIEHGYTLIP